MHPEKTEKLVILGSGPAGLTAAIYSARAQLSPLCIEGPEPGGQLTLTSEVENYPGFSDPILGTDLMNSFRMQASRFGTRFVSHQIARVDFSKKPFSLYIHPEKPDVILADSLIISTGASANWLGLKNEKRLIGKGVSSCATCDGFFFKGQKVAVIGGGDTALEEALFLTRFASQVVVIHRRDQLRASKIMQEKAFKNKKIIFEWNSSVKDILGETAVTGIQLMDTKTSVLKEIDLQGVFVAIGHQPNTSIFKPYLNMNQAGYLILESGSTQTNIHGIFAAGDVADPLYRQAVTAAGTGCMAALDAERYIQEWD